MVLYALVSNTSIGAIDAEAATSHEVGWHQLLSRLCTAAGSAGT